MRLLRSEGVAITDPWDVVSTFEQRVAQYAGAQHGVAVDSCTNALFLCLTYLRATGVVEVPRRTYVSVPATVIHAGCSIRWVDSTWSGVYQLKPYPVFDSAARFTRGMFVSDSFYCLSFHFRKILPICKGGMILTDSAEAARWLRLARYSGRDPTTPYAQISDVQVLGWNMYMPPEQAARGLKLLSATQDCNPDSAGFQDYRDLSSFTAFRR